MGTPTDRELTWDEAKADVAAQMRVLGEQYGEGLPSSLRLGLEVLRQRLKAANRWDESFESTGASGEVR